MRKTPAALPAAPKVDSKTPSKTRPQTASAVKAERGPLAPNNGGTGKAAPSPLAPSLLGAGGTSAGQSPAGSKSAKTIPVKAAASPPAPVRVVAETPATYFTGSGGQAWRLSSRYAIAYVRDAVLAGEMLATEPRHLAKAAMAVYYDRKGKAFAWQFRFDTSRWAEVVGRLG